MIWLIQILTIAFAVGFAWQQSDAIKAFRDYVPVNNPYMKSYHKAGWVVAALFVIGVSVIPGLYAYILVNAMWYYMVFDIALNKFTDKDWDYIGNTAWFDKRLNQIFTNGDAGEAKAMWCLGINIVLNVILHGQYIG